MNSMTVLIITLVFLMLSFIALAALIYSLAQKNGRLKKELEASERYSALLKNTLQNIDVATWSYDHRLGRVVFASRAFLNITGYPPEAFTGKDSWAKIIHPDDAEQFKDTPGKLRCGVPDSGEYRIIHANGETRWVDVRIAPTLNEFGQLIGLDGSVLDITEKKNAQQEVKETEKRFTRLFELTPNPVVVLQDETFIYANPASLRLFGAMSDEELIGKNVYSVFDPGEREHVEQWVPAIKQNKYSNATEFRIVRLDGRQIFTEATGMYDDYSAVTVLSFYDISIRKRIEIALQESMERYRKLVELSPVPITVLQHGQIIYINPAGLNILGVSKLCEVVGTSAWDWVPEGEVEWCKELLERLVRFGTLTPEEITIQRKDKGRVEALAVGIFDETTSNVELVLQDITARKRAERALIASEKLNRQLIEVSPVAIVLHKDYRLAYVNPAGVNLYGAESADNLIGIDIRNILSEEDRDFVLDHVERVYDQNGHVPLIQHKAVMLDGRVIDVETVSTAMPYLGANAALTFAWDITSVKEAERERISAEQLVRESEDRYFRLQMSLDQFSSDLFGVVKVEDMNSRLLREIRHVLGTDKASVIRVSPEGETIVKTGCPDIPEGVEASIREQGVDLLPLCRLVDTLDGHYVKVADIGSDSCVLCVGELSPLLLIQAHKVWLETLSRYVSVLFDNFRVIEDLRQHVDELITGQVTPQWLLRFMFHLSENERKRLSQDLHDAALQEQVIWYRRLNQISSNPALPSEHRRQLEEIEQGLLDVIYQIRITCNELRPPLLQEEGLGRSLETLFEFTQLRTDFAIHFDYSDLGYTVSDELLIGLYRIVQELLANAAKHSKASVVSIRLYSRDHNIHLRYEDNGIGMNVGKTANTFQSMGIYGMKERIRSMDGSIEFESPEGAGLKVQISVPVRQERRQGQERYGDDSNITRG